MKRNGMKAKKVVIHGFEFDSINESRFYEYLIQNKEVLNIKEIELQQTFDLIPAFKVPCLICQGLKVVLSTKGNMVKCKRCKGSGEIQRRGLSYTPDFIVTYNQGHVAYFDVKNGRYTPKEFPYYKKVFEWITGNYLIIATPDKKGGWNYK